MLPSQLHSSAGHDAQQLVRCSNNGWEAWQVGDAHTRLVDLDDMRQIGVSQVLDELFLSWRLCQQKERPACPKICWDNIWGVSMPVQLQGMPFCGS